MITSEKHLLYILKTDSKSLDAIISNIDSFYFTWEKPKLNKDTNEPVQGKTRTLNSTKEELKTLQKRIYKYLKSQIILPNYFFGGVPKKDNISNAKFHQGNKYIFTTDLKSFFPSINNSMVFKMFLRIGCTPSIAKILTQLTTYKHQVPQGVPTSTLIANLVFQPTGDQLYKFALEHNIKFSIFVDDISMSSPHDFKELIPTILSIITDAGYKISHQKTFYKTKNPVITGIICQNNLIKIPQSYNKRIKRISLMNLKDSNLSTKLNGLSLYKKRIKNQNKKSNSSSEK